MVFLCTNDGGEFSGVYVLFFLPAKLKKP